VINSLKGQASYWFDETKITSWRERTEIIKDIETIILGFEEEFLKKYTPVRELLRCWFNTLLEYIAFDTCQ